jgi:hypothetical protein
LNERFPFSLVLLLQIIHIYGIIYLIGDYNLVRRGRINIIDDIVSINVGIRRTIEFDIKEIESIRAINSESELVQSSKNFWAIATPLFYKSLIGFKDEINCQITLKSQVKAYGFLGISRYVEHVNLSLDNCNDFLNSFKKQE